MAPGNPVQEELRLRERAQGGVGGWLDEQEDAWRDEVGESYYLDMLRDNARNKAYRVALERAVASVDARKGAASVLDIGTGSGLLAMMAKRAGVPEPGTVCCVGVLHTCHFAGACTHANQCAYARTAAASSRAAKNRQEQPT